MAFKALARVLDYLGASAGLSSANDARSVPVSRAARAARTARRRPTASSPADARSLSARSTDALEGRTGYVPLSPEEERDLGRRARAGDEEALWTLVMVNVNFARSLAARYRRDGLDLEDLTAEGITGLFEAATRFDPDRGIKFITYASWWVRRAILRYLRTFSQAVHVPKYKQHEMQEFWRTHRRLSQELGRAPSTAELIEATGTTHAELQEYLSLSLPSDAIEEPGPAWTLESNEASPEDDALRDDALGKALALVGELDPRSRGVVVRRFGLDGSRHQTLASIGADIGLTKERVRQIEKQACRTLRAALEGSHVAA